MKTIEKFGRWTVTDLPARPTKRAKQIKPAQEQPRRYALDIGKAISMQMLAEQYGFSLIEPEIK